LQFVLSVKGGSRQILRAESAVFPLLLCPLLSIVLTIGRARRVPLIFENTDQKKNDDCLGHQQQGLGQISPLESESAQTKGNKDGSILDAEKLGGVEGEDRGGAHAPNFSVAVLSAKGLGTVFYERESKGG